MRYKAIASFNLLKNIKLCDIYANWSTIYSTNLILLHVDTNAGNANFMLATLSLQNVVPFLWVCIKYYWLYFQNTLSSNEISSMIIYRLAYNRISDGTSNWYKIHYRILLKSITKLCILSFDNVLKKYKILNFFFLSEQWNCNWWHCSDFHF